MPPVHRGFYKLLGVATSGPLGVFLKWWFLTSGPLPCTTLYNIPSSESLDVLGCSRQRGGGSRAPKTLKKQGRNPSERRTQRRLYGWSHARSLRHSCFFARHTHFARCKQEIHRRWRTVTVKLADSVSAPPSSQPW